jgi:hypothetical protein
MQSRRRRVKDTDFLPEANKNRYESRPSEISNVKKLLAK